MAKKYRKPQTVNELILEIIKEKKPSTVEELVKLVQKRRALSTEAIVDHVTTLRDDGRISLEEVVPVPNSLQGYLFSRQCWWFWAVVGLTSLTILSISLIPAEAAPLVYVRWGLGFVFVLFLPGFCLVETVFPSRKVLDETERLTLSFGLSLAITPLTALALNYTPWGIRLVPLLMSLTAVTLFLAGLAAFRRFKTLQAGK